MNRRYGWYLLLLMFVVSGVVGIAISRNRMQSGQANPSPTAPVPAETPRASFNYLIDRVGSRLSPTGLFVAYFSVDSSTANAGQQYWKLNITAPWTNATTVVIDEHQVEKHPVWQIPLTEDLIPFIQKVQEENESEHIAGTRVAWSSDGNTLVAYVPRRIIVAHLQEQQDTEVRLAISDETYRYDRVFQVTGIEEIAAITPEGLPIDELYFVSGDNTAVYVRSAGRLFSYSLFNKTFSEQEHHHIAAYPGTIYPLPGSSGYAYWNEPEEYGDRTVHMVENGIVRTVPNPFGAGQVDYPGIISFSPDRKTVCVETGASGYHGYSIIDVATGKILYSGGQYSYCHNWLDARSLVTYESPYYGVGESYWFLMRIDTGEKIQLAAPENPVP